MRNTKNKPHTIALSFDTLEQLLAFAETIAGVGIGVYEADALDSEFKGRAPMNSYVLRSISSTSKPESMMVKTRVS